MHEVPVVNIELSLLLRCISQRNLASKIVHALLRSNIIDLHELVLEDVMMMLFYIFDAKLKFQVPFSIQLGCLHETLSSLIL